MDQLLSSGKHIRIRCALSQPMADGQPASEFGAYSIICVQQRTSQHVLAVVWCHVLLRVVSRFCAALNAAADELIVRHDYSVHGVCRPCLPSTTLHLIHSTQLVRVLLRHFCWLWLHVIESTTSAQMATGPPTHCRESLFMQAEDPQESAQTQACLLSKCIRTNPTATGTSTET